MTGHIEVYPKDNSTLPSGPISNHLQQGVVFLTYSLLTSRSRWVQVLGCSRRSARAPLLLANCRPDLRWHMARAKDWVCSERILAVLLKWLEPHQT